MSDPKPSRFACFDIDGTIFRSSLVLEAVYSLIRKGVFPDDALTGYDEQLKIWKKRSSPNAYDNFIEAVVDVFGKHIVGVSRDTFERISETVVNDQSDYCYVYTRELVKTLKASGYKLIAISGSPSELVERFAKKWGFNYFAATEYLTNAQNVYTGERIAKHRGKDIILDDIVKANGLNYEGSIAVGDTRGDVGMLEKVEKPIAFNPDKDLYRAAQENKWKVVVERKNVIYEL
jgi:HAD superfamily hydrolase (TIGR01490 family)